MIATVQGKSSEGKAGSAIDSVRERTRRLLQAEIAFIDNPCFREMERQGLPEPDLHLTALTDLPPHVGRGMPAHLLRLCEVPLLSPQQEQELFRWMNYYRFRANALRSKLKLSRPSAPRVRQIERWLERSDQLRNHIVRSNTRLVISIVKQMADDKNPFDDLLSEGITCLVRVVDKFDVDRGFRFSTYATRAVRREVWRLVQKSHRDRNRFATGSGEVLDACSSEDQGDRIDEATWKRLSRELNEILGSLDERERFIVSERFGMNGRGKRRTFQSLGDELGVCKERVRQLEIRAMRKLRDKAQSLGLHLLEV